MTVPLDGVPVNGGGLPGTVAAMLSPYPGASEDELAAEYKEIRQSSRAKKRNVK